MWRRWSCLPTKNDNAINVKVEFGEDESKVPLDNIAKRFKVYNPKEQIISQITIVIQIGSIAL